jgi:hypothetical protein
MLCGYVIPRYSYHIQSSDIKASNRSRISKVSFRPGAEPHVKVILGARGSPKVPKHDARFAYE